MRQTAGLRGILAAAIIISLPSTALATFSIAAYDPVSGESGVAVQSRVFGVGARVAWVRGGVGAIATQAQSNESFGPIGLELLESGLSAQETLDSLLAHDELRDRRQVGIVDTRGGVAAWTGSGCMDWAGHAGGLTFTCQGNILAQEAVVKDMVHAFEETRGQELGQRMIAALEAAQAAGGDKRGRQSAALLIGRYHPEYPEYSERYVSIHVDDHATPIAELRRLYEMYEAQGLVQAHTRFAELLERTGQDKAARREYDCVGQVLARTLKKETDDAGMLNSLAWFAATHDIYLPETLEAARRAVDLEPENTNILDTLAEVYFRMGNAPKAIEIESRASEMSPEDEYLKEQLARFRAGER